MAEILLFGGTTEGRELAELLGNQNRSVLVSVATEYGESLLPAEDPVSVLTGRLDRVSMEELMIREHPRIVIDATHPYAVEVSRTIRSVCKALALPCWRVRRETRTPDGCLSFASMEDLTAWLNETTGVIFSTLGAKEAAALGKVTGAKERLWLRILPLEESLHLARKAGIPAKHIICMQGPFSQELNEALFQAAGASILLTKESGRAGGFEEKLRAARACGMTVALLTRPQEEGLSLEEIKTRIKEGIL